MLYTMESASEAGAASYNVSADELGRFVEMLSDGASGVGDARSRGGRELRCRVRV